MLFDREDGILTVCEIKYTDSVFVLEKADAKNILNKMEVFEAHAKVKKQVMVALITTEGLKPNIWSEELIQNVVTLKDLLRF